MSKKNGKTPATGNTKSGKGKLTSIPGGKAAGDASSTTTTHRFNGNGHGHDADDRVAPGNTTAATGHKSTNVVDLTSIRAQRSLDNRRVFERFFMQHLVDAYYEIPGGREIVPVELVEVSETGCSFRLPSSKTAVIPRDTSGAYMPVQMRLYFSKDSYLRVGMFVVNSTRDVAHGGHATRFGCRIDESFASSEAYRGFVRFMEQFANHATREVKPTGTTSA